MGNLFRRFSESTARLSATPQAFEAVLLLIVIWAGFGPVTDYSENWQLVLNTGGTIVSVLMMFLMMNANGRADKALHLKIDELIRSSGARNKVMGLESNSDETIAGLEEELRLKREEENDDRRVQEQDGRVAG